MSGATSLCLADGPAAFSCPAEASPGVQRGLGIVVALWLVFAAWGLAACNKAPEAPPTDVAVLKDPPPAGGKEVGDDILPSRIKQALSADKSVDATAVSVSVDNGHVTLNGTVAADQITRIDTIVRGVTGVKEVINALRPTMPAAST